MRNTTEDEDAEVVVTIVVEIVVVETTTKREDKQTNKAVVGGHGCGRGDCSNRPMLNVTIVKNRDITQGIAMPRRE